MNELFLHLIDTLSLPLDERGARRALRDFAEEAGFRFFAYLYLKGPETFVVSNYPREWQALYVEKSYLRVDPVITNAKHGPSLFTWSGEDARQLGRRAVSQFFSDAARFGICSGLSVSVPVGFRDRMVFTLAGEEPRVHVEGGIDPVTAAVAVAFVHSRLAGARSDASLASEIKLSPREAECLRWFAEGVSMPDIAVMLNLSERTVRSYIDVATRKVGAANNRQAGTIAARLGLIQPSGHSLVQHGALPINFRHMTEPTDDQAHELVLRMHVEHGDAILMPSTLNVLPCPNGLELAQVFEDGLRLPHSTLVFADDRTCDVLELGICELCEEGLDRVGGLDLIQPDIGARLCSHRIPAAWFAVRPRKR